MIKNFFIVKKINAADDPTVRSVEAMLHEIIHAYELEHVEEITKDTLVIAIGGDGTMLQAMRLAHTCNATATGINLGRVGFLTDFPNDDDLQYALDFLIASPNHHPIEERIALMYRFEDQPDQLAFNEFVISNQFSDHLIKYKLYIEDRCAGEHRANALIIGTPTGSTAYSLSAGGGLLLPTMEAMQIVPVAPISLTSRPIIVPSKETLRVKIETTGIWTLKSDGYLIGTFDRNSNGKITITQHPKKVKILHHMEYSFFDMLTKKLGWRGI